MSTEIKKEIQLEIAHVLFIDIVGYSKLSINDQRTAIDELTQAVRTSEQFQKAEAAARLIKIPTGDGMALVFYKSPEEPVECALEISRALKDHPKIQLRMGAHSGPVSGVIDVNGQANLAGAGINMAQRVMGCGDAGHILLSKRVADDLGEYEHWRPLLHDLGECEVKHGARMAIVNLHTDQVGNPQLPKKFKVLKKHRARMRWSMAMAMLLALAAIVAGMAMFSRNRVGSTLPATEKSIAVLPFENLSADKENAYFASGIQDEILTKLAAIDDLKVISRASTEKYRSHPEDIKTVASELGVATILEGSVQKAGDSAHINVQLIDARIDSHLWAQVYDRDLKNIFAVEGEVAEDVAAALKLKLLPSAATELASPPTKDPAAYDLYLRAIYAHEEWFRGTGNLEEVFKYLRAAIARDPNFAKAYAALAIYEAQKADKTEGLDSALENDARANAEKALTLQPDLPVASAAMGLVCLYLDRNYSKAIEYLKRETFGSSIATAVAQGRIGYWSDAVQTMRRVVELNPRDAHSFEELALYCGSTRHYEEALSAVDRAITLDPNNWFCVRQKAELLLARGQVDAAREILKRIPEQVKGTLNFSYLRWETEFLERDYSAALQAADEMVPAPADTRETGFKELIRGLAALALGKQVEAMQTLDEGRVKLEAVLSTHPDVAELHQSLASIQAARGEKERALEEAEKSVALLPIAKEAERGLDALETLAEVHAHFADADQAIPLIRQLLNADGAGLLMTPALLKLDPIWDPIRSDPRFKAIVQGPVPETIYH